jgi:hypothetical protein
MCGFQRPIHALVESNALIREERALGLRACGNYAPEKMRLNHGRASGKRFAQRGPQRDKLLCIGKH